MREFSNCKSDHIPRFRPVFKKWIDFNKNYCQLSNNNDIPWGYIERASVSIFAAACWSVGCIALEEYCELKNSEGFRSGKGDPFSGRCDLYVGFEDKAYVAEAKMVWPSLDSNNWKERILSRLEDAKEAVRKTNTPNNESRLGLVIVAPSIPRNRKDRSEEMIENFVEFLKSRGDLSSAWVFPKQKQIREFHWNNEKQRMWPGTAILVKALRATN